MSTKIVKTLQFPGSSDEFQINAAYLNGKTDADILNEVPVEQGNDDYSVIQKTPKTENLVKVGEEIAVSTEPLDVAFYLKDGHEYILELDGQRVGSATAILNPDANKIYLSAFNGETEYAINSISGSSFSTSEDLFTSGITYYLEVDGTTVDFMRAKSNRLKITRWGASGGGVTVTWDSNTSILYIYAESGEHVIKIYKTYSAVTWTCDNVQYTSTSYNSGTLKLLTDPVGTSDICIYENLNAKNTAISNGSGAFGESNIAGLKGYYYVALDSTRLFLTKVQTGPKHPKFNEPVVKTSTFTDNQVKAVADNTFKCDYQPGDEISLINNSKYYNCGVITKIQGNTLYVTWYTKPVPFTAIKPVEDEYDVEDFSVFCIKRPNVGNTILADCQFAAGDNNLVTGKSAFSGGWANTAYGNFAFSGGRENTTGYASATFGSKNLNDSQYGFVVGRNNSIDSDTINSVAMGQANEIVGAKDAFAFGRGNFISGGQKNIAFGAYNNIIEDEYSNATQFSATGGAYNTIAGFNYAASYGHGTIVNRDYQVVIGSPNEDDSDALFIIGKGDLKTKATTGYTKETISGSTVYTKRENALVVKSSGKVVVADSTTSTDSDKTLTTKDYVDNHTARVYDNGAVLDFGRVHTIANIDGTDLTVSMPTVPTPVITVTSTTTGNVVTDIAADGHTITVTKGDFVTKKEFDETSINIIDNTEGNVVTDITADGHDVTLTRGKFAPIEILTNKDLNSLTKSGFYRLYEGFSNGPIKDEKQIGASCQLLVMGAGDTATQILGHYYSGHLYTRSGSGVQADGTWECSNSWHEVIDDENIKTNETIVALQNRIKALEDIIASIVTLNVKEDASSELLSSSEEV